VGWLWQYIVYYLEKPKNEGDKTRSIFFATLATQLCVLASVNLGASGLPMDSKNGYIQDFFTSSGPFMVKVAIIETFLSPVLSIAATSFRANLLLYGKSGSMTLRRMVEEPPQFVLADRCAGFMRVVILACAFSPGLPALNFLTSLMLFMQRYADGYAFTRIYRLQPDGAQLSRALELSFMIGCVLHAFTAWIILRTEDQDGEANRYTIITLGIVLLWLASGYVSIKVFRGRDCCGGAGFLCSGWLCCFNSYLMAPHQHLHSFFMRLFFGPAIFQSHDRMRHTSDKDVKVTSHDISKAMESRQRLPEDSYSSLVKASPTFENLAFPYAVWERAQTNIWGSVGEITGTAMGLKRSGHESITAVMAAELRTEVELRQRVWEAPTRTTVRNPVSVFITGDTK
jgi:hypothetical protein